MLELEVKVVAMTLINIDTTQHGVGGAFLELGQRGKSNRIHGVCLLVYRNETHESNDILLNIDFIFWKSLSIVR